MMGVTGNPMQHSISPQHAGPLSPPLRAAAASRANVVPPASPQLQTSRTTPQYPAPQASPRMHQAGSMSPSARLHSYSPKQQMGPGFVNQSPITPTYKANQAVRSSLPRNDVPSRGFMSPSRLMSPPPSSMQAPNITLNQASRVPMSYNGESSVQQYYNQPTRFPQSWQGARQQSPAPSQGIPVASGSRLPISQVPRPSRFGVPQQIQQQSYLSYGGQPMQMSYSGYQQMQNVPTTVSANQQSRSVLPNPSTSLSMPAQNDFDTEFNLDSLLNDPSDGIGSFMQQLQDVTPAISNSNLTTPPILPSVTEPSAMAPTNAVKGQLTNVPASLPSMQAESSNLGSAIFAPTQNITSVNATPSKTIDNTSFPSLTSQNAPFNRENNKLDSGEITLDSTEQDFFKAASSLPVPYAEATIPPPSNVLLNEINELNVPFSVSEDSTPVTSSPSLSSQSVLPTSTQLAMSSANVAVMTSSDNGLLLETNATRKLSRDTSTEY